MQGTQGLRWEEDGSFGDALAILDGDISQAIQSSAEEVAQQALAAASGSAVVVMKPSPFSPSTISAPPEGWIEDGMRAVEDLRKALKVCEDEVEAWGGEFPFQRGLANVEWLEQSDGWTRSVLAKARSC